MIFAAPHSKYMVIATLVIVLLAAWGLWSRIEGEDRYIISSQGKIELDWSTHRREALGSDNWPMTWSDDGHQYTSWGDGGGFGGTGKDGRVSLGFGRVEGDHDDYAGYNVFGKQQSGSAWDSKCPNAFGGKSYGILSINGPLYAFVSPSSINSSPGNYTRQRLYKSTDKGCTWTHIGVEFTQEAHGIIHPVFLQFGQDYAGARDTYVYIYAAEITGSGLSLQAPGRTYLLRVPVAELEDQAAYEWYTSSDPQHPTWGAMADREPVFEDATGVSWTTGSVIHVPSLERYVLVTEHTATTAGNIQMQEAPEPWGPWTEIFRASGWPVGGEVAATNFYWAFSPKWFREEEAFTLVFSGTGANDSWNTVEGRFVTQAASGGSNELPVASSLFDTRNKKAPLNIAGS